ncbi:MAG: peptidoglycan-binding domain-containing protein [Cyanobacteria bacterium J06635_10]
MTDFPPNLSRGMTGPFVKRLQKDLSDKGYDIGSNGIDGNFDENTENAVKAFQKDQNLTVDGVVGDETGKKLDA